MMPTPTGTPTPHPSPQRTPINLETEDDNDWLFRFFITILIGLFGFLFICLAVVGWMFRTGYRLKN